MLIAIRADLVELTEAILLRDPLGGRASAGNDNMGALSRETIPATGSVGGRDDYVLLLTELADGVDDRRGLVAALVGGVQSCGHAEEGEEGGG